MLLVETSRYLCAMLCIWLSFHLKRASGTSLTQCFRLTWTYTGCQGGHISADSGCSGGNDKDGRYDIHYSDTPEKLTYRLECGPEETYEVQNVVYTLPWNTTKHCPHRCTPKGTCCCRGDKDLCSHEVSEMARTRLTQHCTNLTIGYCDITVPRMAFNKTVCPKLMYGCLGDGGVFRCHSRWATVEYGCNKNRGLKFYIIIMGGCIGGLIVLIVLVSACRSCLRGRPEDFDESEAEHTQPLTPMSDNKASHGKNGLQGIGSPMLNPSAFDKSQGSNDYRSSKTPEARGFSMHYSPHIGDKTRPISMY